MSCKIIRDLENYFSNNYNNTGANGAIYCRNSMTVPKYNYLLRVSFKNKGKMFEKYFKIAFFNYETNNIIRIFGRLHLQTGTNRLYHMMPIVIKTNISICGTIYYYHLSQVTRRCELNPRHSYVSRRSLSLSEDAEKLELIEYYMKASESSILNLTNNEAIEREKDHMINLLDKWMAQACRMIFHGVQVSKIEMKMMLFTVEGMSTQILNKCIIVPWDNNAWNLSTRLKINKITSYSNLCIGHVMLKDFFNEDTTFGENIYSSEEQQPEINITANVTIFIPKSNHSRTQCFVYKNGWNSNCESKVHVNFVECVCPSFGYYSLNNIFLEENEEFRNVTGNSTDINDYDNIIREYARRIGQRISYVIIISSLVGFLILCYIIKKLTIFPQQNILLDGFTDNCHYGQVMNDDFLS